MGQKTCLQQRPAWERQADPYQEDIGTHAPLESSVIQKLLGNMFHIWTDGLEEQEFEMKFYQPAAALVELAAGSAGLPLPVSHLDAGPAAPAEPLAQRNLA